MSDANSPFSAQLLNGSATEARVALPTVNTTSALVAAPEQVIQRGATSSKNRAYRVGLVGAGAISEIHMGALSRLPIIEIVGITDIDHARAARVAEQWKIPRTATSLDELLNEQPDVIHILTPPDQHADLAIEALHSGCHVYIEKPLATSVEDCDRILQAATQAGREVCVGHSLLRDPFVVQALDMVRRGKIGKVVAADHFRAQQYPRYAGGPTPYQYREGGFPFRDLGVHSLYLMQAFLGPVKDATLQLGPPSRDGAPLFKDWRVLVACERGTGHIHYSWEVMPAQDLMLIQGTRGVIRVDLMGMSVTARRKGRLPGAAERIFNTANEGRALITGVASNVWRIARKKLRRYHGLQELVAEFYQALDAGQPAPVTALQARGIVDWTERVARQADRAKQQYVARFATAGTATILVTGATGFIGSHLLRRLRQEGQRVRILVRHAPPAEVMNDKGVEVFLGDLGNPHDVNRACQGISHVYHLGATINGSPEDFQCATVIGTHNVIDSCLAHRVEKLIYMSSLSVLHAAAAQDGQMITEDFPLEPHAEKRGLYTQTKLAAERLVTEAVQKQGLRAVILRPGEVVGPDRPFLSGAVGIDTGKRLMVLGGGEFTLPLVWVEDLMDAIFAAGNSTLIDGSILHLVDSSQLSQDQIADLYLRTIGRKKAMAHAPLPLLYTAAFGAQMIFSLLGREGPLSPYRLKSAIGSRSFDCTAAMNALAWQPRVGVRAGLEMMVQKGSAATRCPNA